MSPYRLKPDQEEQREKFVKAIDARIAENRKDDRYAAYKAPNTAEEWWTNLETWWPEIISIIGLYVGDLGKPIDPLKSLDPFCVTLERLKKSKDPEISFILSDAWFKAPDHGAIHANKAWDVLCDLCSEFHVLYPEPPEEPEAA